MGPDDDDVTLQALGMDLDEKTAAAVRADCIVVARRIERTGRRIVGLLPASAEVGVTAIGIQLGLGLAEATGTTTAFVDANLRWPAVSRIVAGRSGDDESNFVTRWLLGQLALITPQRAGEAGAGVPQLARVIQHSLELFSYLVVDLTGFKLLGEHLAAIDMMDGVIVVAQAGRTTEQALLRLNHEMPRRAFLGVLVTHA